MGLQKWTQLVGSTVSPWSVSHTSSVSIHTLLSSHSVLATGAVESSWLGFNLELMAIYQKCPG